MNTVAIAAGCCLGFAGSGHQPMEIFEIAFYNPRRQSVFGDNPLRAVTPNAVSHRWIVPVQKSAALPGPLEDMFPVTIAAHRGIGSAGQSGPGVDPLHIVLFDFRVA